MLTKINQLNKTIEFNCEVLYSTSLKDLPEIKYPSLTSLK